LAAALALQSAVAQQAPLVPAIVTAAAAVPTQPLRAFSGAADGPPPAPWRIVGLPGQKIPLTEIGITTLEGQSVLRLHADNSYGTVTHALPPQTPLGMLRWRWRLDQPVAAADLRSKAGDDAALKVCAMFDMPLDRLGFMDRTVMRVARSTSGEALPAATLCYVWDPALPAGTLLPNAYSARLRFIVLNGQGTPLKQWMTHSRNLQRDFLQAFGTESPTVPPLIAIVIGADADNTHGRSLAYVDDVTLIGP